MTQAQEGDMVKIEYTVTLENGNLISTSKTTQPFEFTIGKGRTIAGIEKHTLGMEVGDKKNIEIPPEEGFGHWNEELVIDVPKCNFPSEITPQRGQTLQMRLNDGEAIRVTIAEIKEDAIAVDANHPLAGETLFCEFEVLEII